MSKVDCRWYETILSSVVFPELLCCGGPPTSQRIHAYLCRGFSKRTFPLQHEVPFSFPSPPDQDAPVLGPLFDSGILHLPQLGSVAPQRQWREGTAGPGPGGSVYTGCAMLGSLTHFTKQIWTSRSWDCWAPGRFASRFLWLGAACQFLSLPIFKVD